MAASQASCNTILRLISASVAVINRAGKITRDIMSTGNLGIVDKGVNDLQTEADRSVQRCIIGSLSKQFPKVCIIGEEVLDSQETVNEDWIVSTLDNEVLAMKCPQILQAVKEEDIVVWVDPLDGTAEYTQGLLDHVTILIGVAVDGKAVGGVIHQPYYNYQNETDSSKLGRTMWGIMGLGAFGIQRKIPPEGKNIVTTTRSHSNAAINASLDALKPDSILRVGGAGHKVLLLIEGKAHAYVFPSKGCKKWDTCAPEALLHIFGGKLTDVHGNAIEYHRNAKDVSTGVLATYDESIHEWYQSRIPVDVRKMLPP